MRIDNTITITKIFQYIYVKQKKYPQYGLNKSTGLYHILYETFQIARTNVSLRQDRSLFSFAVHNY